MSSSKAGPNLGLVCITRSDEVRFKTITRKRLLDLSLEEREQKLRHIYLENLSRFRKAVHFCNENDISLYRMSSGLFPFSDSEHGSALLLDLKHELRLAGEEAARLGIRVVAHPDQFVVLNSESPNVVRNSIHILANQARIMDFFGFPRSAWATLEIHGGKSGRADALVETISELPGNVRSRIALENDEYAYGADQILDICRRASVPMVFDAHHHVVREKLDSYDHPSVGFFTRQAAGTWPDPAWQMTHISNGKESFNDPRHHDHISVMPEAYQQVPWIEIEAKAKEEAIERLRSEWQTARRKDCFYYPSPAK